MAQEVGVEKDEPHQADGEEETNEAQQPEAENDIRSRKLEQSLKIGKEILCLREVKDIRDELKMIAQIFREQKMVLAEMVKEASKASSVTSGNESDCARSNYVSDLPEYNDWEIRHGTVKKMEDDAEAVYLRVQRPPSRKS